MDDSLKSQAFPDENNYGISKRDYFAARALPLAMQMEKENTDKALGEKWVWDIEEDARYIALLAYALADAMLRVREETDPE
jgi:hypothetical protein